MAIKINLVPTELLAKAAQRQQAIQFGMVSIVVVMLIAGVSFMHFMKSKKLEAELAVQEAELKRLAAIVAKVEELEKSVAEVRAKLGVVTDLLKTRPLYPFFMSDFAKSVPGTVTVKSLDTVGQSNNGLKLSIIAESRTSEDIAGWIRALEETGKFSEVQLTGSVNVTEVDGKIYAFTMTSMYAPKL